MVGDYSQGQQDKAQREASAYTQAADTARKDGDSNKAAEYDDKAGQAQATADNWGDNGIYRLSLHAASQAAVGGAAGGGSGAASAGAGVIGGNLGQQAGQSLGEAEADRLGLEGQARKDLVNSYQQFFATAGGALGGMAGGAAAGNAGGTGALASGVQGGNAGYSVDVFNRQLHPEEKARIKKLAGDDPQKEARLTAAACSMAKCYAEYPVDSAPYQQLKQLADIGASDALAGERQVLAQQAGMFGYSTNGVFSDANIDATKQFKFLGNGRL